MKMQVCSDLHLDINIKNESDEKLPKIFEYFVKPNPDCDCLALVGDIAEEHSPIYYKFLIWVSHQFKKVFINKLFINNANNSIAVYLKY